MVEVDKNVLIENISKLKTTELGIARIKRNLNLDVDVVWYCKDIILNPFSSIELKGKNWYIMFNDVIITVNKTSYTIITCHRMKKVNK